MHFKKDIIIRFLVIIFITVTVSVCLSVWAISSKTTSNIVSDMSYNEAIKENKPFIIFFYTDWCSYCVKFAPKYKILTETYSDKYNFVKINADNNEKLMYEYAVGSIPSLYIIDPSINNRIFISNTLYGDLKKIKTELDRYLRIRKMIKQ